MLQVQHSNVQIRNKVGFFVWGIGKIHFKCLPMVTEMTVIVTDMDAIVIDVVSVREYSLYTLRLDILLTFFEQIEKGNSGKY